MARPSFHGRCAHQAQWPSLPISRISRPPTRRTPGPYLGLHVFKQPVPLHELLPPIELYILKGEKKKQKKRKKKKKKKKNVASANHPRTAPSSAPNETDSQGIIAPTPIPRSSPDSIAPGDDDHAILNLSHTMLLFPPGEERPWLFEDSSA